MIKPGLDLTPLGIPRISNPTQLKGITLNPSEVSYPLISRTEHALSPPGFPVLTSKDTACGAKSTENTDVPIETWDVTAGTDVVALWDQWPIAHKGPILQYMAACPSCMFYSIFRSRIVGDLSPKC